MSFSCVFTLVRCALDFALSSLHGACVLYHELICLQRLCMAFILHVRFSLRCANEVARCLSQVCEACLLFAASPCVCMCRAHLHHFVQFSILHVCIACFLSALSGGGLWVVGGAAIMSSSRLLAPRCVAYSPGMEFHGCYGGCDMKILRPSIFVFTRDCRT